MSRVVAMLTSLLVMLSFPDAPDWDFPANGTSRAVRVELDALRILRFQLSQTERDVFFERWLSERDYAEGRVWAKHVALFAKHGDLSVNDVKARLAADERRELREESLRVKLFATRRTLDVRNHRLQHEEAEFLRDRANGHTEAFRTQSQDIRKFEISRAMYAHCAERLAAGDTTDLAANKLPSMTAAEAKDFAAFFARRVVTARVEQLKLARSWATDRSAAWWKEFTIPPTSPDVELANARDTARVEKANAELRGLPPAVRIGDLVPLAAREAFLADWGEAERATFAVRFHRTRGMSVVANSRGQSAIGTSAPITFSLTGTKTITIRPIPGEVRLVDLDVRESLRLAVPVPSATIVTDTITLPAATKLSMSLSHMTEVDMTNAGELGGTILGIGAATYRFSKTNPRPSTRIVVRSDPPDASMAVPPTVIAIPAGTALVSDETLFVGEDNFTMLLECRVVANVDRNTSLDVRVGTRSVPVFRGGVLQVKDAAELVAKLK